METQDLGPPFSFARRAHSHGPVDDRERTAGVAIAHNWRGYGSFHAGHAEDVSAEPGKPMEMRMSFKATELLGLQAGLVSPED